MSRRAARGLAALAALGWLGVTGAAHAATRLYVIAIGNNQPEDAALGEAQLQYADDDAASIAELGAELGAKVTVLSVLDGPSQRRFPAIAQQARPPTLVELRKAVEWHRSRFEADERAGDKPVLVLFFSGHGKRGGATGPSLAMLDGPLTSAILYDEVLARLPARYIHLLVDACHAEAVVRPRDLEAPSADVTSDEEKRVLTSSSLARFPNVGAVVAAATDAQSHEWDAFEQGVFTHELLSALRGAADVNGDGKVEYSEISAFLNAANREVSDQRARLSVLVHAAPLNGHEAVTDLAWAASDARLVGNGQSSAAFWVEDDRGVRLADLRPESGYRFTLLLPPSRPLYVRSKTDEAELRVKSGETVTLEGLQRRPPSTRQRDALDTSLRRGLFASAFGPTYYRGFVDAREDLLPVAFPAHAGAEHQSARTDDSGPNSRTDAVLWATGGGAVVLGGVAATFSALAISARNEATSASTEHAAVSARDRFVFDRAAAISSAAGAALLAGVWALRLHADASSRAQASLRIDGAQLGATVRVIW